MDDGGDSGTTACVVMIIPTAIVCINAGDSQAIYYDYYYDYYKPPRTVVSVLSRITLRHDVASIYIYIYLSIADCIFLTFQFLLRLPLFITCLLLFVSSSLEGFFDESGPFTMAAKGGLMKNPYSWTHAGVNFLALESPVGVGFSYCSNSIEKNATCFADDQSTAKMNKAALIDFFNNKFPELEGGDFYVSGEFLTRTFVFQIRDGWIPGRDATCTLTAPDGGGGSVVV